MGGLIGIEEAYDLEIMKKAKGLVRRRIKHIYPEGHYTIIEPGFWFLDSNKDAACLAQQLYAEKMGWA